MSGKDYEDYQRLCDRVEKIDADAAKWLREMAPKTKGFEYNSDLDMALFWAETPQGHDFWSEINQKLRRVESHKEMVGDFFKPDDEVDKRATSFCPMRTEIALEPRGRVLAEAINTINGQRQDSYGNPEDSFERIANMWDAYLTGKYRSEIDLTAEDVALMMTLMKIARMMTGSGHRDSYIDAAGYIGLAADMGAK